MIENIQKRVLNVLEWNNVLYELEARCNTLMGRRIASNLVPLSFEDTRFRLREITELKEMIIQGDAPDFNGLSDVSPLLNIIKKDGALSLEELFQFRNFFLASERLRDYLYCNRMKMEFITKDFSRLHKLEYLKELLAASITDDRELSRSKYPHLKKIWKEIISKKQEIEKKMMRIINSPSTKNILQEKIFSIVNERYVILMRANMKGRIKGTVHDHSSSGATLYVEPDEIIDMNNKLSMLQIDLQVEIKRILKNLSMEVGRYADEILENLNILAYLDFLYASAKLSISIRGNEPEITLEPVMHLRSARHPLLYLMNSKTVIPSDISLGEDYNCLIISGANTGGKTVLLKTIGLCALLARYGLHIPADVDSVIGMFSNILADIGDDQSIIESFSTFSGQIFIINEMIESADEKSLVLIDEIIVGTSPKHGASLAQAFLESLISTDARIVVTTHYSELKELASSDKRFMNGSVSFDVETLKADYTLQTGVPGASYAIEIARIYGTSENILSRSMELLDDREKTADALVENIQMHKQEIEEERRRIEILKKELYREKEKLIDKQTKLNLRIEEIKNEKGIEFLEELKGYRHDVAARIRELQTEDMKASGKLQEDIIQLEDKISADLKEQSEKRFTSRYIPIDPLRISVGDRVFVTNLEREGKIDTVDMTNDSALIILGNSMRTRYKFKDLLIPISETGELKETKSTKKRRNEQTTITHNTISTTIQTSYNTVDLRGLRVDEAIQRIDQEFDSMVRNRIGVAVVIHGHGTGALKRAVRDMLKFSSYVKDFRPGEQGEGGDGVSIVMLRE